MIIERREIEKLYVRKCPKCKREIRHSSKAGRDDAEKRGRLCTRCPKLGRPIHYNRKIQHKVQCSGCPSAFDLLATLAVLKSGRHKKYCTHACAAKANGIKKAGHKTKPMAEERKMKMRGRKAFHVPYKERLILKYGVEEAERKYEQWKNKLRASAKGIFTEAWFIRKFGVEEGQIKYKERCDDIRKTTHFGTFNKENKNNFSKVSQKLFWTLYNDLGLKEKDCYFAELNHEYSCGTQWNFDFALVSKRKVIEFHGDSFHPKAGDEEWESPFGMSYTEAYTRDEIKRFILEDKGYEVKVVWESEYLKNQKDIVADCKAFLLQS